MSGETEESGSAQDELLKPLVSKPKKHLKPRKGKGFSINELKSAAIPLDDAQKLSISIDNRRTSVHDRNVEVLSALYRKVVAARTEETVKLDISNKAAFKELKQLKGIKSNEAKLLVEAGVRSLNTLVEEEAGSLADDTKIEFEKIEKWIAQAQTLIQRRSLKTSIEELLQLKGMNTTYARKLVKFGILSIEDLSNEDAEILAKDLKISDKIIAIWIEDAMRLTGKPIPKKKKPAKKPKNVVEEPKEEPKKPKKVEKAPAPTPKEVAKAVPELKDIDGISKGDIKELKGLGITTIKELAKEEPIEIASITGMDEPTVNKWITQARELLGLKPKEPSAKTEAEAPPEEKPVAPMADLLKLKGVGKKTAEKLVNAGIMSCSDLLDCDPKELSKKSKVSEKTISKAIDSAKEALE
jgi:predicted flap endonuclease-1-like 5' DNA nuclease